MAFGLFLLACRVWWACEVEFDEPARYAGSRGCCDVVRVN